MASAPQNSWLGALAIAAVLGASAEAEKISDRAAPFRPGQVRLTGWLGGRIDANLANRLAAIDLEERLRPFRNPTEKDGWSGEHVGKWLHAASLACDYRPEADLRRKLAEAAQSLAVSQGADGYLGVSTFLAPPVYAYDDIVANQMYLTGGTSLGEHFQE